MTAARRGEECTLRTSFPDLSPILPHQGDDLTPFEEKGKAQAAPAAPLLSPREAGLCDGHLTLSPGLHRPVCPV